MKSHRACIVSGLLFAALVCGCHRAPSSEYLIAIGQIQNRMDDFRGAQSSTRDLMPKLQALMLEEPSQPHAYAEAAHFLMFVGSAHGWPGRSQNSAEAAQSLLDDAQRLDPDYCPTYWLRTQLYTGLQQLDRALAAAADADARHCADPWLEVSRGRALLAKVETEPDEPGKKDIAAADSALRGVFDAGPGATSHSHSAYAAAGYEYAKLLYRTGRHDELRQHLAKWEAAGQVFDPWTQVNMAYFSSLLGAFDRAEVNAQSALTLFPIPAAHNALGLALYGQAWIREMAGDTQGAAALTARAQQHMADESMAVKTLTGAACCVSDTWKAELARHAKPAADAP